MKAAVWNSSGSLDVADRPVPEPRPGWARVRVSSVGICGTDLHFFRGSFPSPAGLLPGHEVGGTVDALGEGVPGPEPGTVVAVEPLVGCGACPACRAGQYNRCPARTLFGVSARGGLAEYLVVPAGCLYPLPRALSATDGALAEPLAVCARGVRLAAVGLGDRVAVLGAGTIGLMAVLAARAAGAAEVRISARHPVQARMADRLGAQALEAGDEASFDQVIETVGGEAKTLGEAVALARPGGTIAMLGVFGTPPRLPALDFSTKELRLVGSNCYGRAGGRSDFDIGVALLARSAPELRPLVTHRFTLDEVNEAFSTAADKTSGSIKVQLTP
ncbi:MAG: alcohol dehydrogenase catalytic domain-containing protein [Acidimicrobiia bacterium]|nr:alcohol dehydrogenase catalytic domain-containing protein [Acidimicrobiia bacterium]